MVNLQMIPLREGQQYKYTNVNTRRAIAFRVIC